MVCVCFPRSGIFEQLVLWHIPRRQCEFRTRGAGCDRRRGGGWWRQILPVHPLLLPAPTGAARLRRYKGPGLQWTGKRSFCWTIIQYTSIETFLWNDELEALVNIISVANIYTLLYFFILEKCRRYCNASIETGQRSQFSSRPRSRNSL